MTLPVFAQHGPEGPLPALEYPKAARVDVVEDHFGVQVADPYRWLEGDLDSDPDIATWIAAQKTLTEDYLSGLPQRQNFQERLAALYDFERVTAPQQAGDHLFYTLNDGSQNFPSLLVREGTDGEDRVLIDPNTWSEDGAAGLAEWAPSPDGKQLAYAVQEGGGDWRTIKVLDVATGEPLQDEVTRARYTQIAWAADGSGFFYSRVADTAAGGSSQASVTGHSVYFHSLGTDQTRDRLIFETPDQPNQINVAMSTADNRFLIIHSTPDLASVEIKVIDLQDSEWKVQSVVEGGANLWSVIGNIGPRLILFTNQDAPRGKLVRFDLEQPDPMFEDFIPEQDGIVNDGYLAGNHLLVSYLVDAKMEVRRFKLDGSADGSVVLPALGTVMKFEGDPSGNEVFLEFESFDTPTTVYLYNVAANTSTVWFEPRRAEADDKRVVEQRFFQSADGTRVPLFTVRREDLTGPAPTLLLGYGGYGISMLPDYSAALMAWVDQGGVAAIANIRGGGEYGPAWHMAARGLNRQNAFDDFIAAGEYLKAEGITTADGLAIYGDSNGGLLVGAVTNQRPDLVDVALPGVGVMDMIRYPLFTGGAYWIGEFGDPAQEEHFRNLYSYSPYHNIADGTDYPAILAATSQTDTRVVPSHTFKYVAALQAADIGDKPHLARISGDSGHGDNLSTEAVIAQLADMWAFAAHWTGLEPIQ